MDSFTKWLEITFGVSAGAIVLIAVIVIIIKWVFYYTIVKEGAKDAIRDSLGNQNTQLQAQVADMQKQLELQQQEIMRLEGFLNKQ